jgi:hypothetical protein
VLNRLILEAGMFRLSIAVAVALNFYCGSAQAQTVQVVDLIVEYGEFVGKTVTEVAIQKFVEWYFAPPSKTNADDKPTDRAAEQLYQQMLRDPKFRAKHPEVEEIQAFKEALDRCLSTRATRSTGRRGIFGVL